MQIRAGMDRLDGRGRRAERMQDLVARRAVDVGAQPADLKLVRMRAAHVKANDVSGRDAHAIGVGVNSLDGQRAVRRDGRGRAGRSSARHRRLAGLARADDRRRSQGAAGGRQELTSGLDRSWDRAVMVTQDSQARIPFDDLAVDVGQAKVAAGVPVGQPLVVEPQQVQDRGVQVVDVDLVLRRRSSRSRRSCPRRVPDFTPPPASHIV